MKLRHAITTLAAPLLALSLAISGNTFAAAPDTAAMPAARDRATTPTAGNSSPSQQAGGVGQGQSTANTEAQGRSTSQQPQQNAATPGAHECHEGAPELAANANGQRDNAATNAEGSRAAPNQSEQDATNSNARINQTGVDCLPNEAERRANEDARGQGTGITPANQGTGQTRGNQL